MIILPSLLSVPFLKLNEFLNYFLKSGIRHLHIDVMDGHFVPNLSFCPRFVKEIKEAYPDFFLDVHIMGLNLSSVIPAFSYASRITIHPEADFHPCRILQMIKDQNIEAGIALNPSTSHHIAEPFLDFIDSILVMSVNPGFGGQKFLPSILKKIEDLQKYPVDLYVDGGINEETLPLIRKLSLKGCIIGNALMKNIGSFQEFQKKYEFFNKCL